MVARSRRAWGAAIAAGLGLCSGANAYETGLSLGLNFGCSRGGGGPSPTNSAIPPGGVAGAPAVQQTNWNDLFDSSGDNGVGIFNNLTLDSSGVAQSSAARVSWKAQGSSDPTTNNHFQDQVNGPPALQNFELYQGYLDTDDNTTTRVTVRDLPAASFGGGYDVYVYFLGSSSARGGTYGVGPVFVPPPDDPNAVPSVTFQHNRFFNNQTGAWVSDPDLGDVFIPSGSAANGPDLIEDPGESFVDIGNYGVIRGLTALEFTLFATVVGDRTYGFGDRERAPIAAIQLVTGPQWGVDSSGNWSTSGNWSGGVPNAVNSHARFFSIINAARSVTVDVPIIVGAITFNNVNAYTIAGSNVLTLDVTGGPAAINVVAGNHSITAPLVLLDNTLVTVTPAASTLTVSNLQTSAVNLDKAGAGTLAVNHLRLGNVSIAAGKVQVLANGAAAGASKIGTLAISVGAALDLTDNKLITTSPVGSATAGMYDGVSGLIQSGRNGGGWGGSGIVTSQSSATSSNFTSIGVATAQQVKGLANPGDTAVFAGQTVTGSDTLVMYTYGGDANLDGKINVDDYGRIDFNVPLGTNGWYNGDFNYDGKINVDDYGIIDFNIGIQGAPFPTAGGAQDAAAVPEPAAGIAGVAAGLMLLARRRRRLMN